LTHKRVRVPRSLARTSEVPFLGRQSRESFMMKVNKKELKYKLNDLKYCLFLL
jgi:hypothetical protein